MSTRVRILDSCPWPERVGCLATIVAAPADGTYPQPSPGEVLLRLDNDPLDATKEWPGCTWTCVMGQRDVRELRTPS